MSRELWQVGTRAHYDDPAYYDQAYRRRRADVRFYADLADGTGGPVLELGVGTGRVALEVVRRGVPLWGVDASAPMLERARARAAKLPAAARERLVLRNGDLRRVRLKKRFPLVVSPFNVFMHLYERPDIEAAFATVRAHLTPGGLFAFDVLNPDCRALSRDPERVYKVGTVRLPPDGRRYRYREAFDYDPVTQVQLITMIFQAEDDPTEIHEVPLAHRQFFPAELEALLAANGFRMEARYGDFEGGILDELSESQVVLARLAG